MQSSKRQRIIEAGTLIVTNRYTVRECAKKMGISKSTVHIDVTKWLQQIDNELYQCVREVLQTNLRERHIRGGNATRLQNERNRRFKVGDKIRMLDYIPDNFCYYGIAEEIIKGHLGKVGRIVQINANSIQVYYGETAHYGYTYDSGIFSKERVK